MNKAFFYPPTSIETCSYKIPVIHKDDKPTNLGTYYLNIFDDSGYKFKEEVEPKMDDDKIKIIFNKNPSQCIPKSDASSYHDPRLIDPIRNQKLCLDRTPDQLENLSFEDMYVSDKLRNYGRNYTGYDDITGGQIKYWTWDADGSLLVRPIFSTSAQVIGNVYVDPMSNIKPEYIRRPILKRDMLQPNNLGSLSAVIDTTEARENLMASYIAKLDRSDYRPRWAGSGM